MGQMTNEFRERIAAALSFDELKEIEMDVDRYENEWIERYSRTSDGEDLRQTLAFLEFDYR